MSSPRFTKSQKLLTVIIISFLFFAIEIAVGFYTRALVLVADAFHYLTDLVGYIVAFIAFKVSESDNAPKKLPFGWQRATLLGAFFNGVFLLGLGVSIALQSIERFVAIERVQNPKLVLIVGCVGLALNILSATFIHEHSHDQESETPTVNLRGRIPSMIEHQTHRHENMTRQAKKSWDSGRDLGIMGVMLHILGDAANNVGVIIAASVIWKTHYAARFYADPAVSMGIAAMIIVSSLPLMKRSGSILMQSMPGGVNPDDVKHDIEALPGVLAIHDLHIWVLNQEKSVASAHIVVSNEVVKSIDEFMQLADTINECLHAYGIHSATLQPEMGLFEISAGTTLTSENAIETERNHRKRTVASTPCRVGCRTAVCSGSTCCD